MTSDTMPTINLAPTFSEATSDIILAPIFSEATSDIISAPNFSEDTPAINLVCTRSTHTACTTDSILSPYDRKAYAANALI